MSSAQFMMTQARVCTVHSDSMVDVELIKPARCKGCEGSCTWFRTPETGKLRLQTSDPLAVGQPVRIMLPVRYVLIAAALLHGLPWLSLLLGALVGSLVGGTDMSCLIGAATGFAGTLFLTPGWHRRLEVATDKQFRVVPGP